MTTLPCLTESTGECQAVAPRPSEHHAPPGSELRVYLMTMGPGAAVWERFGHNAIWIDDPSVEPDTVYNYGLFDFRQENFLLRFIRGQMWYWMGGFPAEPHVQTYVRANRSVWLQELNLPPRARLELREFLRWNERPENRFYHYDYYRDNCSTRVRDALDRALDGAIRRWAARPSGVTWRQDTRRLNQHSPLLYTGLMVALGRPVDREMSRWDQMFLPVRLREVMDSITVADGSRSVVTYTEVYEEGGRFPEPERPSNWTGWFLGLGVLAGGALAALGRARTGAARAAFLAIGTLWMLFAGVLGLVLAWLWTFSSHRVAYENENVLLFNVLALALAIVLPGAVRGSVWAGRPARRLAFAVAALAVAGLLMKLIPGSQANLDLVALAVPVHLGVALGVSSRAAA
ncbi:MAG: DUF4105 domain-containing protein [Gemmatimonadales bacterium]